MGEVGQPLPHLVEIGTQLCSALIAGSALVDRHLFSKSSRDITRTAVQPYTLKALHFANKVPTAEEKIRGRQSQAGDRLLRYLRVLVPGGRPGHPDRRRTEPRSRGCVDARHFGSLRGVPEWRRVI